MASTVSFLSSVLLLTWHAGTATAANAFPGGIISAATLFSGPASPIVDLGYGRFQGKDDNATATHNYLGMPFANAPRFAESTLITAPLSGGVQDASNYGPACPQHEATALLADGALSKLNLGAFTGSVEALLLQPVLGESEDCLNINVQVPKGYEGQKLPVVHWIHGGAFEVGSNAAFLSPVNALPGVSYQGAKVVQESVAIKQPVIYVSSNYRLNSFGFSASKEFADAGLLNLGLKDQRMAMQWIQNNIAKFGGDPDKVTIWGESAGSWSVSAQLVVNNGDNQGLFRAAIAQSGGPIKVEGPQRQQPLFDRMVAATGCTSATDKISCLRAASYSDIYSSVQNEPYFAGYQSLASPWAPRPDGDFLTASPHTLTAQGKIANVPVMIGDMRDEGTLFSQINHLNTTTTQEFEDYFNTIWWPTATTGQLDTLAQLYPQDPTAGSPYNTGLLNALTPQYKRIASLTGDYSFEAQRRQLLQQAPGKKWTYLADNSLTDLGSGAASNVVNVPILGSFHGSDIILYDYGTLPVPNSKNIMDTVISFVSTLDPNNHGNTKIPTWPEWTPDQKAMYHFIESGPTVITDNYREAQMDYINANADSFLI